MTPAGPSLLLVGGANPLPSSVDIVTLAIEEARARGIRVHLTQTRSALARTAGVGALADAVFAHDPDDPELCEPWLAERRAEGVRYDLVLGLRDSVQESVARSGEWLGVPGNPPEAVRLTRNKDACRAALAAAGFRQPAVRLCTSAPDAAAFLRHSRGPWVVKPRDGMASIGVRKVLGPDELPAALAGLPDPDLFLVEEFVEGPEYSVEGVVLSTGPKVLAVTEKEVLPPPHFVEIGHVLPAPLPPDTRAEIDRQVTAALTALGLRFGVFHAELWLTGAGVVLGEIHTRPGGDWLHRLLTHAIPGLELFGLLYDDALGRRGPRPPATTATRGAAVRFLVAPPGRLTAVDGWEELLAHPSVLHAELTVAPGDMISPVRQSGDRAGYVVVGAPTPEAARETAARLADSVRFRSAPAEETGAPSADPGRAMAGR
ncbi:ATP-grasp domain-containing protein [Streptomyces sp. MBT65]|uniref:ATP-grasp domain-containing protein n=1 Tax=Streptomyces sp. MBT65 TaxID=1488395 RepID=UPI00190C8549|nr:ATP-grasp domain-containing protein [Streptomyces sp. MBT65]MBK3580227.1 ATP-grasp domain-containing protein [Streptomyces sp. MBT65]